MADSPALDPRTLSGEEFLQAMIDGRVPRPEMANSMGLFIQSVEPGRVVFHATADPSFTNPMGVMHGGWYGTLLDTVLGCAVMSKLPAGSGYSTLEYKVNLIRAAPLGRDVEAIGTASHVGRSTGVATAEIRAIDGGALFAQGSTTCLVMQRT